MIFGLTPTAWAIGLVIGLAMVSGWVFLPWSSKLSRPIRWTVAAMIGLAALATVLVIAWYVGVDYDLGRKKLRDTNAINKQGEDAIGAALNSNS